MANRVISIEVGYTLTKICEVDYKAKKPRVYQCFCIKTPEGALQDGYIRNTDEFSKSLKEEIKNRGIKTKQVVFSISSSKIANREVYIPFVKKNKIYSLVQANVNDYFPVDVSGYQLAYSIMDVVEEQGTKQYKLLVLAAPKDLLESYYTLAEKAGLTIEALDYSGNSIVPIVRTIGTNNVTMIIKVDERSALLTVFGKQNIVLQRSITYGVDIAIDTLIENGAYGENLSYEDALNIFRENIIIRKTFDTTVTGESDVANDGPERRKAREEITEALGLMVGSIVRVVDYYNSRNSENPIENFYITGLGADFRGLNNLLTTEIGAKVGMLNKVEGINLNHRMGEGELGLGSYMACIGAAIDPVDFIPDERKKGKKAGKAAKGDGKAKKNENMGRIAIAVFAVGLLAAAGLAAYSVTDYVLADSRNKDLKEREAQLAPIEEIYQTYQSKQAEYIDTVAMYNTTKVNNENLPEFIRELESKMPSKVNFLSFSADKERVTINLNADTKESAATVIAELRSFDSLASVETQQISETTDETGITTINFTVTCTYKPVDFSVSANETSAE